MSTSIYILLLVQLILIALNAIFASAEIAVLSMNETKLERMAEQGDSRAKRLVRLTQEPARFLATIQVAITLSGFLGSAFAADNFSEPLVDWVAGMGVDIPRSTLDTVAVIFITLILSYFTLVFGELVPKRIAMKKSDELAMGVSGLVTGISIFFKPIVSFLSISTNAVLKIFGIDPNETEDRVSEEEIRMLVDAGSEKGTIDHQEKEFIQNVFEFNDVMAGTIATHRTDVTILWMSDDVKEWDETIHNTRHTLYPVCGDSIDRVIGILNAKDYFRLKEKNKDTVIDSAISAPYFVMETTKADVLFKNMKQSKQSMAIVLDEYGGVVGIVTLIDLLEEIVGDLNDIGPVSPEETVVRISDNKWEVKGNIRLSDIEDATGVTFAAEDCDTFTGFLFQKFSMVPKDGAAKIELEIENMHIIIDKIKEHQVEHAIIEIIE
mgnify:CR=1 FL=1